MLKQKQVRRIRRVRAHNSYVRSLPPEQQQQLALSRYDQFYRNRLAGLVGASSQPSPYTRIGPQGAAPPGTQEVAVIEPTEDGIRRINFSFDALAPLIYRYKNRRRGWQARRRADWLAAHETAHIFQEPELYRQNWNPTIPYEQRPIEALANQFADQALAPLDRQAAIRRYKQAGNRKAIRRLRRTPLPSVDVAQFGSNYGADPRTIRYPGT